MACFVSVGTSSWRVSGRDGSARSRRHSAHRPPPRGQVTTARFVSRSECCMTRASEKKHADMARAWHDLTRQLPAFEQTVGGALHRRPPTTLQVNIGLTCNMACTHCHVASSPARTETMSPEVAERVVQLLRRTPSIHTLDITGGAPELHAVFRWLVRAVRATVPHVHRIIDRCNLTVLLLPGEEDLGEFLATHRVDVVASLPCYSLENVDRQRGQRAFDGSVIALQRLNALGYGRPGADALRLDLVYNPGGAYLAPPQAELERQYRRELNEHFGIAFHRLLCLNNMPIQRFADDLWRAGELERYMQLLVSAYNASTADQVMCLDEVHVAYDGSLYDCDFHYALGIPTRAQSSEDGAGRRRPLRTVFDLGNSFAELTGGRIATALHCYGCTAGHGSSCGGALEANGDE
ncbi:hypothetical protein CDCA_CDCA06G1926 [Cyanidium caldarium]|uniref:Radical SAM/Cys-rich domain protein n=1 Tax=Cyanidium caldarium TaxID=2771 RepID=A0AAV9IV18_CYACA|nr:hypothetical protein CDCA_CDCA06G1926 [Cyanidium caldarium]